MLLTLQHVLNLEEQVVQDNRQLRQVVHLPDHHYMVAVEAAQADVTRQFRQP
jgi:hypothetical protein